AGFEESGIPVVDPGSDRTITANARDRAAFRGTYRFVDGAVARQPTRGYRASDHGDTAICPSVSPLWIFYHGRDLWDLRGHITRTGSALCGGTADRHSTAGKNGRVPWALSLVRWTHFAARSR